MVHLEKYRAWEVKDLGVEDLGKCRAWVKRTWANAEWRTWEKRARGNAGLGKWRTWGNAGFGKCRTLGNGGPGGVEGWKMEDLGIEGAREMKILEK